MSPIVSIALPAAFGAAIQELAYWWQLRFRLESDTYRAQIRSRTYWAVVLLMIAGSAIGTWIWFSGETVSPKDSMVFGAGFPLIFKQAVGTISATRPKLGATRPKQAPAAVVLSYFNIA